MRTFPLLFFALLLAAGCSSNKLPEGRDPGALFDDLAKNTVFGLTWGSKPTGEMQLANGRAESYAYYAWPQGERMTGGKLLMVYNRDRLISVAIDGLAKKDYAILRDRFFKQHYNTPPNSECKAPDECWTIDKPFGIIEIGWDEKSANGHVSVAGR